MKNIGKINRLGFLRKAAFPILISAWVFYCSALQAGDDWSPKLTPADPEDLFSEQLEENDVMPNAISSPGSKSMKKLPLPAKHRSGRSSGRQVAFDSSLEPGGVILPRNFLDEETVSEGPVSPPTISRPKKSRPVRSLETDAEPLSPAADIPEQYEISDNYYEYPMDEIVLPARRPLLGLGGLGGMLGGGMYSHYPMLADATTEPTGYPVDENIGVEGLYNQLSSETAGCYFGPLIKPFGTGCLDNLTFFGGVTGFKGEVDGGFSGNFGFTEGINWSVPVSPQCTVSAQFGLRAVQSNLGGYPAMRKDSRNQYFLTGGFFKRDLSHPLQGGVVFDWFHDEALGDMEVSQIRCELSLRTFSNLEYGFLGAFGMSKDRSRRLDVRESVMHGVGWTPETIASYELKPQNTYMFFFRKYWACGGMAECRFGGTDYGDAVISGLGEFPLNDSLSVFGSFTGMIPKEGHGYYGWRRETWDISVGFILYFRGGACDKTGNPCRPMFDVASNGSFLNRIFRR